MSDISSNEVHAPDSALDPVSRATEAQRMAADPFISAFVSANAGSGKTKVLVDRVLRLLLEGAAPGRILCLTYTKAAAAHMAVKVFDRLAGWVGLADEALAAELASLEGRKPGRARLDAARRLFARAVETPGGLKIETIHAFCERVLHLAPFEANVPARFEVLDEAASEEIYTQARRAVLTTAARGENPALAAALTTVSLAAAGDAFDLALRGAIRQARQMRDEAVRHGDAMTALATALDLRPGDTLESVEEAMLFDGYEPHQWPDLITALSAGSKNDQKLADSLRTALASDDEAERLSYYLDVFFKSDGEPRADKGFPTKSVDAAVGEALRDERDRLAELESRRRGARVLQRTDALLTLAEAIAARVDAIKHARGALDFDDLIGKTRTLLLRSDAASWILHKLDAGIDHVLVDEAQDTNPAQWDILRALTSDFSANETPEDEGENRKILRRTIFAVGDPKQSIYGFQGAEPRAFAESERHYRKALADVGASFKSVPLNVSFRSAPAVLAAVDRVFGVQENFAGLAFDDDARAGTVHETSRIGQLGRVEIWEPAVADDEAEPDAWDAPVDAPDPTSPAVALAGRIAAEIGRLIRDGDETGRRTPSGDVLVLVRKRGALFDAIISALKSAGLKVAGADRLTLGDHIAVLDLLAAGRAALLPEDDLTLAAFLKTPLVGLNDDELMAIAAGRGQTSLYAALVSKAEKQETGDNDAARRGLMQLRALRKLVSERGAFGFYATLLGPMGGRTALVARLGPEAADAIDEFLALALGHERQATPSLAGFIARFGDATHDVKRDMDESRGEIRVMTVHGAKGLEADVVVLADACRFSPRTPGVLPLDVRVNGRFIPLPVWMPPSVTRPPALQAAASSEAVREREEHNRLLYVALTRARRRLIIAPYFARNQKNVPEESWYGMIDLAFGKVDAPNDDDQHDGHDIVQTIADPQTGAISRVMASGRAGPPPPSPPPPRTLAAAPAWLFANAAREEAPPAPLSPSRVTLLERGAAPSPSPAAAVAAPTSGREAARFAGTLLHTLLEHLPDVPAADRPLLARRYVDRRNGVLAAGDPACLGDERRNRIVDSALALVAAPQLAPLFGANAIAEAPIAGVINLAGRGPTQVSGQIDRLAVAGDTVWLADFKLASLGADTAPPQAYVAQLALYAALLRRAWPGKTIRPLLVYAEGPRILALTEGACAEALASL